MNCESRHINDQNRAVQLRNLHSFLLRKRNPSKRTTGMPTTRSKNCTQKRRCKITGTFTTVDELRSHRPRAPVVAHNRHATTVKRKTSSNCGISTVTHDCARTTRTSTQTTTTECTAIGESQEDHRNLPLRHDRGVNDITAQEDSSVFNLPRSRQGRPT